MHRWWLLAALVACSAERDDTTFADPPPSPPERPPLGVGMTTPSSAAERLYELGVAATSDKAPTGGYWHFKECAAFYPRHALCQRAVGVTATHNRLPAEAAAAFKKYLELKPDAEDREEVLRLIAELETRPAPVVRHDVSSRGAVLVILSEPTGAEVFINGERTGLTPLSLPNRDPSVVYDIVIRKVGYREKSVRLPLHPSPSSAVLMKLEPILAEPNDSGAREAQ
jgi:hypothetical protein